MENFSRSFNSINIRANQINRELRPLNADMLVDRMINTLVGDRFNRNYEIHIFNSHTLLHSSLAITFVFSLPCSRSTVLAYISLIRSFLEYRIFALEYLNHTQSDHTTPLLYSHSRHTHPFIQASCIFTHLWQPLPHDKL